MGLADERTVMVRMRIIRRSHIFHQVDAAAFGTPFLGAVTGHLGFRISIIISESGGSVEEREIGRLVSGQGRTKCSWGG